MPHYAKPYLPIADQIALIKGRGLAITDDAKAADALHRIGYYRLSGYWFPMRQIGPAPGGGPPVHLDAFKPNASFADVIQLYVFDKKLRLLIMDAIERVEVGLRVEIALLIGKRGPHAHRDPKEVHPRFITPKWGPSHSDWLQHLDAAAAKTREEFGVHFRKKYTDPLPIWMAIELWDFGSLSIFLSGMKDGDLNVLASHFGLPRRDLLTSWVRSINYVRNICAHHLRLWNRVLIDLPAPPKAGELAGLDHLATAIHAHNRLYAAAVALRWFLKKINPTSSWPQRLATHFTTFPQSPHYYLSQTGFPVAWDKLPFWS